MGGLARFLLGCAVGVALGILISRKRVQKIPTKGVQPLSPAGMVPAAPEPEPGPEPEAAPEQAFELSSRGGRSEDPHRRDAPAHPDGAR
jgi:hypothetical protein